MTRYPKSDILKLNSSIMEGEVLMKKRSIIFMLSFISYFFVIIASPHITARTWADLCLYGFFAAVLYQLLYIAILRKKDKVSLGRSIARTFLYAFIVVSCNIVMYYIDTFINGYIEYGFLSSNILASYYGFDAWANDFFANIIYVPSLIIIAIYDIAYFAISKKLKRRSVDLAISKKYELPE